MPVCEMLVCEMPGREMPGREMAIVFRNLCLAAVDGSSQ